MKRRDNTRVQWLYELLEVGVSHLVRGGILPWYVGQKFAAVPKEFPPVDIRQHARDSVNFGVTFLDANIG